MERKKNLYVKILLVFFAVMAGLTVVSRAADSVTVARIEAESPTRGMLTHQTNGEGTISASEVESVQGVDGFLINKCYVDEGQEVESGEPLFGLDIQEVSDKLAELESDVTITRLQLAKLGLDVANDPVETAKRELERAIADDAFTTEFNGGKQMLEPKRKVEDARAKLLEAQNARNSVVKQNSIDAEILKAELPEKEREVQRLRHILQNGGMISAEIEGTVSEIFKKQGETMNGETVCTLIPKGATYLFKGEIDRDDGKFMKSGDDVGITLSGQSKPLKDTVIKSVVNKEGMVTVTVELPPDSDLQNGGSASFFHEQKTSEFSNIIPLSALRGSEGDYFIYVIGESNSILGQQQTVSKVEITLLEKDKRKAAIEGVFERSDLVISASSKAIGEGDRVRLEVI